MFPLHALFAETTIDRLFDVLVYQYGWIALVALGAFLVLKTTTRILRHRRRKKSMTEILAAAESAMKTYRPLEEEETRLNGLDDTALNTPLLDDDALTGAQSDTGKIKVDQVHLDEAKDASGGQLAQASDTDKAHYIKMMAFRSGRFGGAEFGAIKVDLEGPVRPPTLRRPRRRRAAAPSPPDPAPAPSQMIIPDDAQGPAQTAGQDSQDVHMAETVFFSPPEAPEKKPGAVTFRVDPPSAPPPGAPPSPSTESPPAELDGMFGNVMRQGQTAAEAGDWKTAAHYYSVAMAIHPDSEAARQKHSEAKARVK